MGDRLNDRLILLDLVAAVQCKGNHARKEWETIAAFDLANIAEAYADTCRAANPQFEYRVVPLDDANQTSGESRLRAGATRHSEQETS